MQSNPPSAASSAERNTHRHTHTYTENTEEEQVRVYGLQGSGNPLNSFQLDDGSSSSSTTPVTFLAYYAPIHLHTLLLSATLAPMSSLGPCQSFCHTCSRQPTHSACSYTIFDLPLHLDLHPSSSPPFPCTSLFILFPLLSFFHPSPTS